MNFILFSVIPFLIIIFASSLALTATVRSYAQRHHLLDHPNQRSSHLIPTPRGGGIAIVATFLAALFFLHQQHFIATALFWSLTLGGLVIAAIGACDDFFHLRAKTRVTVQFGVALFALIMLHGLPILDFGGIQLNLHWIGTLIGIISIVWLTNLYNFMDGIDGLAGTQAIFVCLSAAGILWYLGEFPLAIICVTLAVSCTGFILFNWPPATIFLGDVGSGFLGYTISVIGIYASKYTALSLSFWLILLAIFICDTTFTLIHRVQQKKVWYAAHREHAYQCFILRGATHRQVILAILSLNVCLILPLALLTLIWPHQAAWTTLLTFFIFYLLWRRIVITHATPTEKIKVEDYSK